MADKLEPSINSERDPFRDSVTIVISLIIPLIIAAIGLFAGHWISAASETEANYNCSLTVGVTNYTNYANCVSSNVLHLDNEQYVALEKYLNRSFILLFIILIFFLAYLLLSGLLGSGYVKYIMGIVIVAAIIWEFAYITRIAVVYGALYSNPSALTGYPMGIVNCVFNKTNIIIVPNKATNNSNKTNNISVPNSNKNNTTNNIFVPKNFVQWYFNLFIIIFFELILLLLEHPIKRLLERLAHWVFKNKRKKQ